MYSLENLFTNSTHKNSIFTQDEIKFLEEKIYTKNAGGKETPYVKCAIRNKEIKLTPEETVRQLFIYRLIKDYGYKPAQIKLEHPIHFGREVKKADIVIFEESRPTVEYIIVEVKKFKLSEGKEQLKSYCHATGAPIGVWTNGNEIFCYHRTNPNRFESISDIPNVNQTLEDILCKKIYIDYLIENDILQKGNKTLKKLIVELEDDVLANAGVDAFEEVFKLIYTKLYDEFKSGRDKTRPLEFRNYYNDDEKLEKVIQKLFKDAQGKWQGVFPANSKINLSPSHLAVCVSALQDVKLFNSNLEVIDDAFEYLMSKSQKGEKGQYFTPRYVIDMCVKMLNPKKFETMIDTAAGSCGFPMHTIFYVWHKILEEKNSKVSHLLSLKQKPPDCEDYVDKKVFAIDFDEKAVRVARTLNLIAGDGKTNVMHLNTLDYETWNSTAQKTDWQKKYSQGWLKFIDLREVEEENRDFNFDIVMANPPFAGDIKEERIIKKYELGKKSKDKYQSKIGRDILFIERNLQFLKPGGRMAIILPQGRFNNSSDKYIRDFIAERCRILAVVGLHGNVFKPHTGTKTSVLFVQKWDDELCPQRDDYPIFFATMQKPSKDNSGEKIYVLNDKGEFLRDKNKHVIVDHDLFNHDGLTRDGIAEAFIEFAKKENLSFFDSSSFDETKYNSLLKELECIEILLSESAIDNEKSRLDSEFFQKKYIDAYKKIKNSPHSTIGESIKLLTDFHANGSYENIARVFKLFDEPNYSYMVRTIDLERNNFVDDVKYINKETYEFLSKSKVYGGEVIINKIGTPGRTFLMPRLNKPVSLGMNLFMIDAKSNGTISNELLYLFLNSNIGKLIIERKINGTVPLTIDKKAVRSLYIPAFSKNFQEKISEIVKSAHEKLKLADKKYKSAEQILSAELGLENFEPPKDNVSVKSFSASFGKTGRLDAEFYQPKYDALKNSMKIAGTVSSLCKIYDKNFEPENKISYRYIELANVDSNGNISSPEEIFGADLPTRARRIVKGGQVIISSIEGSLQSCALITNEHDGALCSTGFFVIDSVNFNSATLLVLFKSELMQSLMKQSCTGTILTAISKDNFLALPLPVINVSIQEKIAAQVEESFVLRSESKRLLEVAKRAVEVAIEDGEDAAEKFIESN